MFSVVLFIPDLLIVLLFLPTLTTFLLRILISPSILILNHGNNRPRFLLDRLLNSSLHLVNLQQPTEPKHQSLVHDLLIVIGIYVLGCLMEGMAVQMQDSMQDLTVLFVTSAELGDFVAVAVHHHAHQLPAVE